MGKCVKNKPYLPAHWQERFIIFTDLGKAEWSEALGKKMVTKEEEKGGQNGTSLIPRPLRRPWETGDKPKTSCLNLGSRVSAFPETDQSMELSGCPLGEACNAEGDTATLLWRIACGPTHWEQRGGSSVPHVWAKKVWAAARKAFLSQLRWNLSPNISFQNILWLSIHMCTLRIVCVWHYTLHFIHHLAVLTNVLKCS